ncbi:type VII toxin-antitoxin system MntA family adenylyltransferase antitoxin [Methylomusa anaerophila]|uniref:Nucleotidyltransferase domain protein n=1 Tax=Methylomusa anaerophila TaxID=1930071 RepID=A0A348AR33_9FIRM|nr:nucleotidyltransferase domain-containing protein [Methylomusa anaerophila]BBB93531.1 nucleotidyltransferase domain protein [Methylomusa anaerophila]
MQEKLESVFDYFRTHERVRVVWLFGSFAQGTARKDSDIDFAVLFEQSLSPEERFSLRLELMDKIEGLTNIRADVIDMESAPVFLQHQVRKTGRVVVEKDRERRIVFDVRSRREYFDFQPVLARRSAALLKKCGVKGGVVDGG